MALRAGIVGPGLMGKWHAHYLAGVGGDLVAVCDADLQAARKMAEQLPAFTDPVKMFQDIELDVVHICSPAETHYAFVAAALASGVHVIVEKPMAPTAEETERLYEIARENNRLLSPVYQFLFQRGVAKARAALSSIGDLLDVDATFCSAGAELRSDADPDSIVDEILLHPLSLMEFLVPGSLEKKEWIVRRPRRGEVRATTTHQGTAFSFLISLNSRPTCAALRLLGSAGAVHVDLFHGFCVVQPGIVSRWEKIIHPFDFSIRTLAGAGSNLATRALSNEPAFPGLRELIESFYRAAGDGAISPVARELVVRVAAARDFFRHDRERR